MSPGGYLLMATSWALIIALNLFCFWRLARSEQAQRGRQARPAGSEPKGHGD